jgi:hypothetical protein
MAIGPGFVAEPGIFCLRRGDLPRLRISKSEVTAMKRLVVTVALAIVAGSTRWGFADDAVMAAVPAHKASQLTAGPELESATDNSAIIRWTSMNPGGTALHFGVVHYGTDAKNLTQVAQSPNRRNPSLRDTIFRVRIMRLNPNTTYYYKVESTGATGARDGAVSSVRTFKTQLPTEITSR